VQSKPGDAAQKRNQLEDDRLSKLPASGAIDGKASAEERERLRGLAETKGKKEAYDRAYEAIRVKQHRDTQEGQLGVELSVQMNNLRSQSRLDQTALRNVNGRNCIEIGGVWLDEGFDPKMKMVKVKAQSDAYFRILERQPQIKDVFRLGNHVLWVTPNGSALVIDLKDGVDKLEDKEIDELFVAKKK
jgi:Ca-activated chloride channel family protein